jgi:hypothetical protein
MSAMMIVWGILTTILVGLLIYRSILTTHEGDQLFLDSAEAALEHEQAETLRRIQKVDPYVRWLGGISGALALFLYGWWLYFVPLAL